MNAKYQIAIDTIKILENDPERKMLFDNLQTLVLMHQTINLQHLCVGEDGQLYMVNFSLSGYYPVWFEYVAVQREAENRESVWAKDKVWKRIILFVCGLFFKQKR